MKCNENGSNRHQSVIPKVSVIVPVFNTDRYLHQCLNSLRVQTMKDIEIIVVDDGSTDESGLICDYYSNLDARFVVIHKENEGLSEARNIGIKLARAEYIMLVDSDDWVEPTFCEVPYYIARKHNIDLVVFQFRKFAEEKEKYKAEIIPTEGIVSSEELLTKYSSQASVVAWNKLYRKSLFNGVNYPIGYYCEDVAITHHLVFKANRGYLLADKLYNYRELRPGSITESKSRKFLFDGFFFSFKRIDELKDWGFDCKNEETKLALAYLIYLGPNKELSERCKSILDGNNRLLTDVTLRQKVMYLIYKVSPKLFDGLSIISRKRI